MELLFSRGTALASRLLAGWRPVLLCVFLAEFMLPGLAAREIIAAEPQAASPQASAPAETGQPRLELTITGPQTAAVGSRITFEVVVANAGTTPATKLLAIDNFDPGLVHDVAPSPIEHDLKDLRPGQSQRLGLAFRVTRPGKLTHQIQITQQGKVLAAARSTVIGIAEKTRPPAKDAPLDFPEIMPRDQPPEEKLPDLGPPLVDRPENLRVLNKKYPVWIDRTQRSVVLVGVVCQRQAPLELFACLRGSKEHESVLSVPTKAAFVHAALLAVGAEPGSPVQFRPKYVPPTGPEIEITCVWKDAQGKRQTARAQDWVRNIKTGKPLEFPWVFGGSRFLKNPASGATYYQADADGDFICVSNFPGAMLDLPIPSTSSDADLLFETFTEHIPPRGTPVTLILTPKPKKSAIDATPRKLSPPSTKEKHPVKKKASSG